MRLQESCRSKRAGVSLSVSLATIWTLASVDIIGKNCAKSSLGLD